MATYQSNDSTETTDHQRQAISTFAIGDIVNLQIKRILPFGLTGTLANGAEGVIRVREMAWDEEDLKIWQANHIPGSYCEARIIDEHDGQWELSLRMKEFDPWEQLMRSQWKGRVVRATVSGFGSQIAYLVLNNGLRAQLAEDELPSWVSEPIYDALWIGDHIYAKIKHVNPNRRELHVTMKELADVRWSADSSVVMPDRAAGSTKTKPEQWHSPIVGKSDIIHKDFVTRRFRILVIEDDDTQNKAIANGLAHAGHEVDGVLSGRAGLEKMCNGAYDFVICDVNLGEEDGIATVKKILDKFSNVCCILMTDWMTANYREAELLTLNEQGAPLLIKPVIPEEFLTALATPERYLITAKRQTTQSPKKIFVTERQTREYRSVRQEIADELRQLRTQLQADKVVLFRLHVTQHAISVVVQQGGGKLVRDQIAYLIYSPVRDVAEDGRQAIIDDVTSVEAYARHLIPLLQFRSCVGVPIPADISDRYALFLFHEEPNFPSGYVQREVNLSARLIGGLLERQLFHERNADLQRTLLMGHLSRALIHETNHQMSPILFILSDLADQCRAVEYGLSDNPIRAKKSMNEMRETIEFLTENMRKLVKTTRLFARIAVQDSEEPLRMGQVIKQCLDLVRDSANRAHIHLHQQFPQESLITQLKQTQVQQVIVNLLLNAIQQIERIRPEGGRIKVMLELARLANTVDVIKVTIEDDGPGIHQRQWEEIFELGVTTRINDGSGMGLYISRRLMEDCGGRLYVKNSYVHWGTSMVAEFPIYLPVD